MEHPFLDLEPDEIARRVREVAELAAGGPVVVRVGEESFGFRNVGVDLPRARRSKLEARNFRVRVSRALEGIGVSMRWAAVAPRCGGDLEGSVRVRVLEARGPQDASGLARPPPGRAHLA